MNKIKIILFLSREGLQTRNTDSSRSTCGCRFDVFSSLRSFAWANDTENISKAVLIIFIFIILIDVPNGLLRFKIC